MSYAVARAVVERALALSPEDADVYARAVCTPAGSRLVEEDLVLVERPAIASPV